MPVMGVVRQTETWTTASGFAMLGILVVAGVLIVWLVQRDRP